MWQEFIRWIEQMQFPCVFKKHMGIACPGCGFQSAVIELLKGNIWESIQTYPALVPIITTILLFFIHLKFNSKLTAVTLKSSFFLSITLILSNYIIKLISQS
ncbi:DUF2752 domain-containing protein [Marinifilum fragile]|uniref:DUF2752 domain-containing protein n=1 Tax=Marinifilum fragile TaxID=570161 RepID=UPI0006D07FAB